MANWTDLDAVFAYGTKLTSQQMQQLRDNITALAENASGSPTMIIRAGNAILSDLSEHTFTNTGRQDWLVGVFEKTAGVSTVRLIFRHYNTGTNNIRLAIGGLNTADVSDNPASYTIAVTATLDISSLSNGTRYEVKVQGSVDSSTGYIQGVCVIAE